MTGINGEGVDAKILYCLEKIKEFLENIFVDYDMLAELIKILLHIGTNKDAITYEMVNEAITIIE